MKAEIKFIRVNLSSLVTASRFVCIAWNNKSNMVQPAKVVRNLCATNSVGRTRTHKHVRTRSNCMYRTAYAVRVSTMAMITTRADERVVDRTRDSRETEKNISHDISEAFFSVSQLKCKQTIVASVCDINSPHFIRWFQTCLIYEYSASKSRVRSYRTEAEINFSEWARLYVYVGVLFLVEIYLMTLA